MGRAALIPGLAHARALQPALERSGQDTDFSVVDGLRVPLLAALVQARPPASRALLAVDRDQSRVRCGALGVPHVPARRDRAGASRLGDAAARATESECRDRGCAPVRPARPRRLGSRPAAHRGGERPRRAAAARTGTRPGATRRAAGRAAGLRAERARRHPRRAGLRPRRPGHPPWRVRAARRHPRRLPARGGAPGARRLLRRRARAAARVQRRRPAVPARRGHDGGARSEPRAAAHRPGAAARPRDAARVPDAVDDAREDRRGHPGRGHGVARARAARHPGAAHRLPASGCRGRHPEPRARRDPGRRSRRHEPRVPGCGMERRDGRSPEPDRSRPRRLPHRRGAAPVARGAHLVVDQPVRRGRR